jgi:hypothetical protein
MVLVPAAALMRALSWAPSSLKVPGVADNSTLAPRAPACSLDLLPPAG